MTLGKSSPRKILVVDDDELVTSALRRSLAKEGYAITVASGPEEALAIMKKEKFDMVMSDHNMPGMTGTQFTTLIRDRYPDTMRVMLTGSADTQMMLEAINHAEVYRFVTKPWDDMALKVTLVAAFQELDLQREKRRLLAFADRWAVAS